MKKWMIGLSWIATNCMCVLATLEVKNLSDSIIQSYSSIPGIVTLALTIPFVFGGVTILASNLTWLEFTIHPAAHAANASTGFLLPPMEKEDVV